MKSQYFAIALAFALPAFGIAGCSGDGLTQVPVPEGQAQLDTGRTNLGLAWNDPFTVVKTSGFIAQAAGTIVVTPPPIASVATCGSLYNQTPGAWTCAQTINDQLANYEPITRELRFGESGQYEFWYLLDILAGFDTTGGRNVVLGITSDLNNDGSAVSLNSICTYDNTGAPSTTTGATPYVAFRANMVPAGPSVIENYGGTGISGECGSAAYPVTFESLAGSSYTLTPAIPTTAVTSWGHNYDGTSTVTSTVNQANGSGTGLVDYFHSIVEGVWVQYGAWFGQPIPPALGTQIMARAIAHVRDPSTGATICSQALVHWEWSAPIGTPLTQYPVYAFQVAINPAPGNCIVQGPDNRTPVFGNPF